MILQFIPRSLYEFSCAARDHLSSPSEVSQSKPCGGLGYLSRSELPNKADATLSFAELVCFGWHNSSFMTLFRYEFLSQNFAPQSRFCCQNRPEFLEGFPANHFLSPLLMSPVATSSLLFHTAY